MGEFGDTRRILVADVGGQRRYGHERGVQIVRHPFAVGCESRKAVDPEGVDRRRQQADGTQEVVDADRHKHVELKIALRCRQSDSNVVCHDLHRHHGDSLALSRIDLAGHDGRPRFVLRDADLTQPATRTACQPPHIVGDFHEVGSQRFQRPMRKDQLILGGQRVKFVGIRNKVLAGQPGQYFCRAGVKSSRGVQSGADGGPAQRQMRQLFGGRENLPSGGRDGICTERTETFQNS